MKSRHAIFLFPRARARSFVLFVQSRDDSFCAIGVDMRAPGKYNNVNNRRMENVRFLEASNFKIYRDD